MLTIRLAVFVLRIGANSMWDIIGNKIADLSVFITFVLDNCSDKISHQEKDDLKRLLKALSVNMDNAMANIMFK